MTGTVAIILVCIVGAIVLLGILTSYLDASTGAWRELADRYPPEPHEIGAESGSIRVFILTPAQAERAQRRIGCLWIILFPIGLFMWWRRAATGIYNVRYTTDRTHLHLDLESGVTGAQRAMSIPFVVLELTGRGETHLGPHAWFALDGYRLGLPESIIEQELTMREMIQGEPDGTPGPELPEPS